MEAALQTHYDAAVADAAGRGVADKIKALAQVIDRAFVTVNVMTKILRNLCQGDDYVSVYEAVELGHRQKAQSTYQAHRAAVDAKVHTGYEGKILNAALSPNGDGFPNYDSICLRLRMDILEAKASVLRENAYDFYERYDLGRRNAEEPLGWRSTWLNRSKLGVAHLAAEVSPATALEDLSGLVMSRGTEREGNRYIEVHIFGRIDLQVVESVALEKTLTDPLEQDDWEYSKAKLSRQGIGWSE